MLHSFISKGDTCEKKNACVIAILNFVMRRRDIKMPSELYTYTKRKSCIWYCSEKYNDILNFAHNVRRDFERTDPT